MNRLIFGVDGGAEHDEHVTSDRGTGWCLIEIHGPIMAPILRGFGQVPGGPQEWLQAVAKREAGGALGYSTEVVVEGFTRLNARAKIDPLEIVGMMEMYAMLKQLPCTVSRPGARTAVSHEDLKRIGFWPGGKGHADAAQAIRHVLAMLLREGHRGTAMLVTPPETDIGGFVQLDRDLTMPEFLATPDRAPTDLW